MNKHVEHYLKSAGGAYAAILALGAIAGGMSALDDDNPHKSIKQLSKVVDSTYAVQPGKCYAIDPKNEVVAKYYGRRFGDFGSAFLKVASLGYKQTLQATNLGTLPHIEEKPCDGSNWTAGETVDVIGEQVVAFENSADTKARVDQAVRHPGNFFLEIQPR